MRMGRKIIFDLCCPLSSAATPNSASKELFTSNMRLLYLIEVFQQLYTSKSNLVPKALIHIHVRNDGIHIPSWVILCNKLFHSLFP